MKITPALDLGADTHLPQQSLSSPQMLTYLSVVRHSDRGAFSPFSMPFTTPVSPGLLSVHPSMAQFHMIGFLFGDDLSVLSLIKP